MSGASGCKSLEEVAAVRSRGSTTRSARRAVEMGEMGGDLRLELPAGDEARGDIGRIRCAGKRHGPPVDLGQPELGREVVERVEGDPAIGRQLAAGDRQHPALAGEERGLAAGVDGRSVARRAARAGRRRSRGRAPCGAAPARRRRRPRRESDRCRRSVAATSPGSPSYSVSVVPRRSIPSQGYANVTRTWSWGIVRADDQGSSSGSVDVHSLRESPVRLDGRVLEPSHACRARAPSR